MRLEILNYYVRDMRFGPQTAYDDGVLTICKKDLLAQINDESVFERFDLQIASPGDSVRITNILEISAPRVKADGGPACYFPGMGCPPFQAGRGKTNALKGCAVMEIGRIGGMVGGVVDMLGFGAGLTPFSATHNLCLLTLPQKGIDKLEYGAALKRAGLQASIYLAKTTLGLPPEQVEVFELADQPPPARRLPKVGYLFQVFSTGNLRQPFIYGANYHHYFPTLLHPNEILDGAMVCGHYDTSVSLKNTTYSLLNHPVILDMYSRHGREIDFQGVVITPEPTTMVEIKRTAMMSANLLKNALNLDGVVITKEGGGHTSVDLMANCDACEALDIHTVLIDNEWLGREGRSDLPALNMSRNADAIVSIGNIEEVVDLEAMERVIGGNTMDEVDVDLARQCCLPIRCMPESISQLGAGALRPELCRPDGGKRNLDCGELAARRALDMLLRKMTCQSWQSEIPYRLGVQHSGAGPQGPCLVAPDAPQRPRAWYLGPMQ